MSIPQSLTATLIQALSQSEDLQRRVQESNEALERLKQENESLKREVEELRQARSNRDAPAPSQLEHLFTQNAEKQAEIDHLKSKLRQVQAKERKWRLQNPQISSPMVSSDDVEATTPASVSRKRPRSKTPNAQRPLGEISANVPPAKSGPRPKRLSDTSRVAVAIPAFTEDGEDHNRSSPDPALENLNDAEGDRDGSASRRLQDLLSGPPPATPLLPRPVAGHATPARPLSNARDQNNNSRHATSASKSPVKRHSMLPPKPPPPPTEDEEPFRSRPVHRRNLTHFKANPAYTGDQDHAYDDVVRGRGECCGNKLRSLAATTSPDRDISEKDLLAGFLGPGADAKIRNLTRLEKDKLLLEARAKRHADKCGQMPTTTVDRPQSPPGYWNTDMPGTQEDKENREKARMREREEVERRYQEAMRGDGRWLFADEC
ncbi:hypothetical protein ABEF95_006890 [Exophiala dermatitidis]